MKKSLKRIDSFLCKHSDFFFSIAIGITFLYSVVDPLKTGLSFFINKKMPDDLLNSINSYLVPFFTVIFILDGFFIFYIWNLKRKKIETIAQLKERLDEKDIEIQKLEAEKKEIIDKKEKEIEKLISSIDEIETQERLNTRKEIEKYIRNIAINRLNFNDLNEKFEERISLYVHDDKRNKFLLIYRFSRNPLLSKKGRPFYDDSIGAIGEAWQHGKSCRTYSCKYDENPVKYKAEFLKYDPGFPIETVEEITMKPSVIIAIRLETGNGTPYGIVVLESNKSSKFTITQLCTIFNNCVNAIEGLSNKLSTYMNKFDKSSEVLFHESS